MKILNFNTVICRLPAFGINQSLQEVWEPLKLIIAESSPSFYGLIKDTAFTDLQGLNDKIQFTIWKYFNRAKYRATPFGSFASLSTAPVCFAGATPIVVDQKMTLNHWIDWSEKGKYGSSGIDGAKFLRSNASIYFLEDEIRYIKISEGSFELASVQTFDELKTILDGCKNKASPENIYQVLKDDFGMDQKSSKKILNALVELQLLQTDLQPNIIGSDYFSKLGVPCPVQASNYIIAQRKLLSGTFDGRQLRHLPAMAEFFARIFAVYQSPDLARFKREFVARFENKEISLARAMDPQIGIGYGDLAQASGANPLVDRIGALKRGDSGIESMDFGKLQQFLLPQLIAGAEINLSDFRDFDKQTATLPNTFSAMFHLYKGRVVLSSAGGCSANALLGRFTIGDQQIEDLAKKIAAVETSANQEVLFFDIAYQAEKKVDNVNRRKQIYPYELPILTWSENRAPLDFSDILVCIEGNEVILKSKILGRRLMPRIPSAYNYTRSDLAVYRFLCDIQSQGILTNLSLNLQDFFPGLAHYPRLSYRGVIVAPAMWLLPAEICTDMLGLSSWLRDRKILAPFKAGNTDQSLTFDPENEQDLAALLTYAGQQTGKIYLWEALLEEIDCVKDQKGNAYPAQFVASFFHQQELYKGSIPVADQGATYYLPGSEWLYVEIYGHSSRSNYLLLEVIEGFVKGHSSLLKKWFFIRYPNPKPHIRLRMHLKNRDMVFALMGELEELVNQQIRTGFVSDIKLQTYRPEMHRYGQKRMDLVEKFFELDSSYVLRQLRSAKSEEQLIDSALHLMGKLVAIAAEDRTGQIRFLKAMAQNFAKEMNMGPANFKQINESFNQLRGRLHTAAALMPQLQTRKYEAGFKRVMDECENDMIKHKMLADLIHMYLNRLFATDQRVYESILYHYLLRVVQAEEATSAI